MAPPARRRWQSDRLAAEPTEDAGLEHTSLGLQTRQFIAASR